MTCSAVAVNTKIDFIVFHTITFRVVPFAKIQGIGSLASMSGNLVGTVSSMKMKSVAYYQKQYDTMKAIATSSLNANVELDSSFQNELLRLTRLVKSIGGRV